MYVIIGVIIQISIVVTIISAWHANGKFNLI